MTALIYSILSVLAVSIVALSGLALISLKKKTFKLILLELVAFSIGAMLGGVFLHILPEIGEEMGFTLEASLIILGGFLFSFIVEKFIHWHHCHDEDCHEHRKVKSFAFINLLGDGIHNFVDGVLIAAAYLVNVQVGIATTIAVALHELPQELGDFAVLIHAGYSRTKALMLNFFTALSALVGVLVTFFVSTHIEEYVPYILPFAAGSFLYLAGTDLIPELHKETKLKRSLLQLGAIAAGLGVMALLLLLETHTH